MSAEPGERNHMENIGTRCDEKKERFAASASDDFEDGTGLVLTMPRGRERMPRNEK